MAPFFQLAIKIGIQRVERAGGGEPLTEHADRVRVGCRRAKVEARETQPTQPVADQVLHVHVAHFVFASPVPEPSASSPGHTVGDRPWCRSSGPAPPPASAVTPQKSTKIARTSRGSDRKSPRLKSS